MVGADRRDVELGEAAGGGRGTDAARDLGVVVERQERDDRERRDAADGLDGDDQLLEVEERLDHEQIDATSLEDACLRRVQGAVLGGVEHLELAERADRARDEDVAPGDLTGLPGESHARGVDLLEPVVEKDAGELAAVRPEGVRLDQLGAGRDVARVYRDDALGSAEVRLLGAAQAGHGPGDERTHAAVGDDRTAGAQSIQEAAHGSATVTTRRRGPGSSGRVLGPGRSGAAARPRSDTVWLPSWRSPPPSAPKRRPVSEAVIGGARPRPYHPAGVCLPGLARVRKRRGGGHRRPVLHSAAVEMIAVSSQTRSWSLHRHTAVRA